MGRLCSVAAAKAHAGARDLAIWGAKCFVREQAEML